MSVFAAGWSWGQALEEDRELCLEGPAQDLGSPVQDSGSAESRGCGVGQAARTAHSAWAQAALHLDEDLRAMG